MSCVLLRADMHAVGSEEDGGSVDLDDDAGTAALATPAPACVAAGAGRDIGDDRHQGGGKACIDVGHGIAARADAVHPVPVVLYDSYKCLSSPQCQLQQRCRFGFDPAADDMHPALTPS
jgi:hypothetical protein